MLEDKEILIKIESLSDGSYDLYIDDNYEGNYLDLENLKIDSVIRLEDLLDLLFYRR